jgi:hypothetical protein
LPPVEDLHRYASLGRSLWTDIAHACEKHRLICRSEPTCRVDPADEQLFSSAELPTRLRSYRRRQARNRGVSLSRSTENFSAGLAATQVHVGGLPWRARPFIIRDLYRLEPHALSAEIHLLPPDGHPRD